MSKTHFRDVDTVAERRAVKAAAGTSIVTTRASSFELSDDEPILWQCRPKRGIVFQASDVFLIPFSMIWCTMVLSAMLFPAPNVLPNRQAGWLSLSIFGAVALYITVGRFIVDALYRSKLRYQITSKHVIIRDGLRARVTALGRRGLKPELIEYSNSSGTIQLNAPQSISWWYMQSHYQHACLGCPPHLYRIRDARNVFEILLQTEAR